MKAYLGIDLGTTYSCISRITDMDVEPKTIELSGKYTMPSVVHYDADTVIVGESAKQRLFDVRQKKKTVELAKLWMGTDKTWAVSNDLNVTPVDVSSEILKKLIEYYKEQYGEEEYECVITCPANYMEDKKKPSSTSSS